MTPLFEKIAIKKPQTSRFDLSHDVKLSFEPGYLVPPLIKEVLPGDEWWINAECILRFAPMLAPVLHRINLTFHYFFIPNRLLWNDSKDDCWETFITGGEDGHNTSAVPPYITISTGEVDYLGYGSLADYLGLNVQHITMDPSMLDNMAVNALPFRAYLKVYNDYYRDQNLTEEIEFDHGGGEDQTDDYELLKLRRRCWEKDYFTSALPWAQRGDAVKIPFMSDQELAVKLNDDIVATNADWVDANGEPLDGASAGSVTAASDGGINVRGQSAFVDPKDSLVAETKKLQNAATIEDLRTANRVQRWLERNARAGGRYIEQILSHFNVRVPDYRLDRPEFLGGGRMPVSISEVLQTSSSDLTSAQGNMAGHGVAAGSKNGCHYRAYEHGFIICIMSCTPRSSYQQGLDKMWHRFDRYDYGWPEFANLGEQEVKTEEVFWTGSKSSDQKTFGYQSRYSEYKFANSRVAGDFKSTLNYWHLGRIFSEAPSLNEDFVACEPSNRIFAVENGVQHLYALIHFNISVKRRLPFYSNPIL